VYQREIEVIYRSNSSQFAEPVDMMITVDGEPTPPFLGVQHDSSSIQLTMELTRESHDWIKERLSEGHCSDPRFWANAEAIVYVEIELMGTVSTKYE